MKKIFCGKQITFSALKPKATAILPFGVIAYYVQTVGNTYYYSIEGKFQPLPEGARGLNLRMLALLIKHEKDIPFIPEWEPLLNKRGFTLRGDRFRTLEEWCEYRTDSRDYEKVPEGFPCKWGHGAHISTLDPHYIAYYPDRRYILRDVPMKIKPGRYLKKYFPEYSDDEIRRRVGLITGSYTLKYYSAAEDMINVYRDMHEAGVVESCMSKNNWKGRNHPLCAYDHSDIELAVMYSPLEEPKARALYNVETKQFAMIYGEHERMLTLLEAAGFEHGPLDGAKINRIESDNGEYFILPYIDGEREIGNRGSYNSTCVEDYGSHLVIDSDGDIEANDTSGATTIPDRAVCKECGNYYHVDDLEDDVCESCRDEYYVLAWVNRFGCQRYIYEDDSDLVEIDGEWYASLEVAEECGVVESDSEGIAAMATSDESEGIAAMATSDESEGIAAMATSDDSEELAA